jgi:WD40 repeat protein
MRFLRFSISQLLLAATLIALIIGLFTAANRLGPRDNVCQLCFSPSGKLIAARYQTGIVRVWRLVGDHPRLVARAFGQPPLPLKGSPWLMECIYFADDNRLLKAESHQLKQQVVVRELDLATGKISEALRLPIRFAQQWNAAVSGGDWGTGDVLCCNLKDRKIDRRLTVSPDSVHALQVSVDGRILAAIDQEGMANIVDLTSDKVVQRMPAAKTAYLVHFLSADGSKLITPAQPSISRKGVIQKLAFWDTSSGEVEERPTTLEHGQYWLSTTIG